VAADGRVEGPGLTPRESRFVDGLARGEPMEKCCTLAGISPRTGRRWRVKAHVAAAVRARIAADMAAARAVLSSGSSRAAAALVAMADGTATADAARATAASRVLDHATKLHETVELEGRIAALEAEGNHGD
jgi:hypothetical protein